MKVAVVIASIMTVMLGCKSTPEVPLKNSCSMNGAGNGTCSFSNEASVEQAKCVSLSVISYTTLKHTDAVSVCSGSVPAMSSKSVKFIMPDIGPLCTDDDRPWMEVCALVFTEVMKQVVDDFMGAVE